MAIELEPVYISALSDRIVSLMYKAVAHFFFYRKFVVYEKDTTGCISS